MLIHEQCFPKSFKNDLESLINYNLVKPRCKR